MSIPDNTVSQSTTDLHADRLGARARFIGMAIAYATGTFNDNFFKAAALLLAVDAGLHTIQGVATFLFALPFVLFSAWTGWLADRLPKRDIVAGAKVMELAAMLLGLWTLLAMNWTGMVVIVFLMGLQSTFFGPALNGAIPESFPTSEVPRVNALLKLATTAAILLGIAMAGVILDLPLPRAIPSSFIPKGGYAFGRLTVGIVAALVSVIGLLAALSIKKSPAKHKSGNPFPLFGPLDSVRHAMECYGLDKPLFLVLSGEAFFYFLSSFVVLVINNFGIRQLGFSMTLTSLLSVALMIGVCIGSIMAGRFDAASWRRFMVPSGTGMAAGLFIAALAPFIPGTYWRFAFLILAFTFAGFSGGYYLIPLVSFIQVRPRAEEKGKILGIAYFACFSGILISGLIFAVSGAITPALLLAGSGCVCLAFMFWAASFKNRLPDDMDPE